MFLFFCEAKEMMRLVGQIGCPIAFFFVSFECSVIDQTHGHRVLCGPFFKPFRLEKAHSAPPSHLCFLLVQLLPHCLSETRDSTRVHSFALGSGTHTPIHLSPFSFCLAVVMPSHPSSSCSIPSSSCSVLPLLPSFL